MSAQSSHAKNHLLFLMPSLTSSLTCPDIQDLKMTFHLAASDAATAIFVVTVGDVCDGQCDAAARGVFEAVAQKIRQDLLPPQAVPKHNAPARA